MNGSRWSWKTDLSSSSDSRADVLVYQALKAEAGQWEGEERSCSRSQIKKLMDEGKVTVGGVTLKPHSKLRPGDLVQIDFPAPRSMELIPEDRPIEILYQDEHLLVLNKPPGLTVHPSATQMEGTLVHALLHHVKDLSGIGGVLRPGIVHRLDKDTSGALVISKTDDAHRALVETFSKHAIERRYWALCYGAPEISLKQPLRIETTLGRNPSDRKRMMAGVSGGRKAITYVSRLEAYAGSKGKPFASWLEATLETGRTHQVRVHLTSIHHSILGDPVYGAPTSKQTKWLALPDEVREIVEHLPGQALHARVLGFDHPVTGKRLRFEAEPPPVFQALLDALRKYRLQP